jgi:hypothetical protein
VAVSDTPYHGTSRAAFAAGALLGLGPSDLGKPAQAKARRLLRALELPDVDLTGYAEFL